jgi:hypothetical protein
MNVVTTTRRADNVSSNCCTSPTSPFVWNVSATRAASRGPVDTKRAGPGAFVLGGGALVDGKPPDAILLVVVVAPVRESDDVSSPPEHAIASTLVAAAARNVRRSTG